MIPPSLSFLANYGIFGLYVSVVLVVGRFMRMTVSNMVSRIPYEDMPQVQTLQNLCALINMARCIDPPDLALEQQLYKMLIGVFRSTELLEAWSQPSSNALGNGPEEQALPNRPKSE